MPKIIKLKKILLTFCAFLLCQCSPKNNEIRDVNPQLASPYTQTAATYMDMARLQEHIEKQANKIKAAGRMIQDGHWRKGLTILSQTSRLSGELNNEKQLLLAKVDLMRERPSRAIFKLSSIKGIKRMPLYYQIQYHEQLAQAYQMKKMEVESVNERIVLDKLLPDASSQENNRRKLWLSLTNLPAPDLNALVVEAEDGSELQGWLKLALIPRQNANNAHDMLAKLQDWLEIFPNHPASNILPKSLSEVSYRMYQKPNKIALLLPTSGPLSGPAGAIKDGFMKAAKKENPYLNIRTYDTNKSPVKNLYQTAIDNGAEYIIGPLVKSNVAQVAEIEHPVPTLLLNNTDAYVKENAYLFALSPESEARQVAIKARQNGNTKALIIAPEGEWGQEITKAFQEQWINNGGTVIDSLFFTKSDSMNSTVKRFLRIDGSEKRKNELKKLLGKKMQATLRRRQDFDMIFLLAYPTKARQIVPLLKYYYAVDTPVYATSAVFSGSSNTIKDRDLNGVIFCDMPWVFTNQTTHKHWPEQFNSYNRLFALGMDSYALTSQLNQLMLFPTMGAKDKSGILYLKGDKQVARILEWGQIRQGLAQPLAKTV